MAARLWAVERELTHLKAKAEARAELLDELPENVARFVRKD